MSRELSAIDWPAVDQIIKTALAEDIRDGDVTTDAVIPPTHTSRAYIQAKASGIVAGLPIAGRVFQALDAEIAWHPVKTDGDPLHPGETVAEIDGSTRALLTGERLALNILQRMSGIASLTTCYVEQVGDLPVEILDTRKTLPGLRCIEKYAVAAGGGSNHRFGLFDGIMIKDNHIRLCGGIAQAVDAVRKANPRNLPIEVETTTLSEVAAALAARADIIMLDNMSNQLMSEAVALIAGRARVEASGGVNLETVRGIAETGVDCISVGALTHSAIALDLSLYFR